MDVVLGVAVTGPVARLALVGAGTDGSDVIDQSVVDLANNPVERLAQTVVGTNRLLANDNHRLVGTRLCWTDHPSADRLRQALEDSGVHNVAVLSQSQAVTALMRAAGRSGGVLVVDDNTATLSVVGSADTDPDAPPTMLASELLGGDATGTLDTMIARLGEHPDASNDVYLVGASSDLTVVADQLRDATMRVQIPEDPTFALARGAAIAAAPLSPDSTAMAPAVGLTGDATAMVPAAGLTGDATAMAPAGFADPDAADQQLAYSMADDDADLLPGEFDEFDDYYDDDDPDAETGPLKLSRPSLLVGNAVIAFAVIGMASLAVAVVVAVRPTASQEPVVGHQNAAPGKFMPLLPTQQQAPVPPPPPEAPNAGYQGGIIQAPAVPQAPVPGFGPAPGVPVPGAPVVPGLQPNPNGPVPIPIPAPIIVPYPGWRPQPWVPPYYPPYTPPTTTTYPPTTPTTSPPTTPTTPTTVAPTTPTTTPYTPPTTTVAPTTTPYTPMTPTTTVAPTTVAPTTVAPTTVAPTTVAPTTAAPTQQPTQQTQQPTQHTQQPTQQPTQQTVAPKPPTQQQTVAPKPPPQTVAPKPPSGGGGGHSSSGS